MKINIQFETKDGAYGGCNQFIKALKSYFGVRGEYTDKPSKADIILFNSMHQMNRVLWLRRFYPNKIFVHRVDGPCKLYNNMEDDRDDKIYMMNDLVADATVFQSIYSREASFRLGCPRHKYETVIMNASDASVFYPIRERLRDHKDKRVRIIASSFSSNWKKGFKTYQWMDEHLDFEKYEMVFVGRSPCEFKKIKMLGVMNSQELAEQLRSSDIYITASQNESCSNSLIEAISCGLPTLAIDSGSNPEIVFDRNSGYLFKKNEDIPYLLDLIIKKYDVICKNMKNSNFERTGDEYYDFFSLLLEKKDVIDTHKKLRFVDLVKIYLQR